MTINILKIGKLKTISDIKKYDLNKPIFLDNYLFHYLILTNNLSALKLYQYPVYKQNSNGYNGIILASKNGYYNILKYFIKTYPKYIYSVDIEKSNFLHYLDPNEKGYLDLVLNYKLNWPLLYQSYTNDGISNLDTLFIMGSFSVIDKITYNIKFKYDKYKKTPFTFSIILNNKISNNEKIKIFKNLYKQDKNIFKYGDITGTNLLYPLVLDNNYNLLEYMYNQNIDFNSYTPINTFHIFKLAYNKGVLTNNYDMANLIWKKIKDKHSFYETNKFGDNLAHFIVKSRINTKKGNYKLEKEILKNNNNWNGINSDKLSVLDLLTKLDYNKYHDVIDSIKVFKNYSIKNNNTNKKWIKQISRLDKITSNDVKLIENKYSHGNLFQARFTDIAIFGKYLDTKYKNLYFPITKKKIKIDYSKFKELNYPAEMLINNLNFPWIIIWNNKDNYFIHPYLTKLIKKNKKNYDYGFVYLSLSLPNDGLHASLVFYDFKNKTIERFDPYGNTEDLDGDIDNVLAKELAINGFNYIKPSRYLPVAGFQTISDENNILNTKFGDFGGYCLAWCIWYIEHRMRNYNIDPKTLVRKTLNKFFKSKYKPMEFIRNYANKINEYRVEYLTNMGMPLKYTSNEVLPMDCLEKLRKRINSEF